MYNVRLGRLGLAIAGLGIAGEWWTFMTGKAPEIVLTTALVAFGGIIVVLTAAVREMY